MASSYLTPENGDCGQDVRKFSLYVFLFRPDGWLMHVTEEANTGADSPQVRWPPVVHERYETNIQFHTRHGQEQSIQVPFIRTLWKRQQIKNTFTFKSESAEHKASIHNGGI